MAYREVRTMDIEQVIRRWLTGEKTRAIARTTGLARNTVRGIVKLAIAVGLKVGTSGRTKRNCKRYETALAGPRTRIQ